MKELLVVETDQSHKLREILEKSHIHYKIYQEATNKEESIFANYNQVARDKQREQEAEDLENSEQEDIVNEEW